MRATRICLCLFISALSAIAIAEEWPADELSRTAIARNQETLARSYKNREGQELDIRILPGADLSDAAFRLTALNLPPNQMLVRTLADGRVTSNRMVDGVWEPFQLAGRQAPSVRTAPRAGAVGSKWPAIGAAALLLIGISLVVASKWASRFSG